MDMSTSQYLNITKRAGHNYVPVSNQKVHTEFSYNALPEKMMRTFTMPSGIGATCVIKKMWPNGTEYGARCQRDVGVGFVPKPDNCYAAAGTHGMEQYCPIDG